MLQKKIPGWEANKTVRAARLKMSSGQTTPKAIVTPSCLLVGILPS